MNIGKLIVTMLLIAALYAAGGCDNASSPNSIPTSNYELRLTPRANYEAEVAALWLSGELYAPQQLYDDLDFGFTAVRNEFGDSIPELNQIWYWEHWYPWEILVQLTDSATAQFRAGEYTDLDSLNTEFALTAIDTHLFFHRFYVARYIFEGNLHPERLSEIYEQVESVEWASANSRGEFNHNFYPWIIGGGTSYLLRYGWGDCPSGCAWDKYWYFKVIGSTVEYIGTYDTSVDPAPPEWWSYAKWAMYHYRVWPIPTGILD